jgi:hypothetical protein
MQRAPLPQDFAEWAGVGDLVHRDARALIGRDVADHVTAGLDPVHVHARQQIHDVGALDEWNPVELHVLPGREMAVARLQMRVHRAAAGQRHWPQFILLGLCIFE